LAAFDLLTEGDMTNFADITPPPQSALVVVKNAEGTSCENSGKLRPMGGPVLDCQEHRSIENSSKDRRAKLLFGRIRTYKTEGLSAAALDGVASGHEQLLPLGARGAEKREIFVDARG
jgi:hypothetical protein